MHQKLGEICIINPKDKIDDEEMLVSFVPMQKVTETGNIDTSDIRIAKDVLKGFTSFAEGDVLMAKITPCMENGKGAIAKGLYNNRGFGSTEFFVIRPNTDIVCSEWIFYYTVRKEFRLDCEKNMTGSAGQKRVPKNYLEKCLVPVPSIDKQKQVINILDSLQSIIIHRKQQLEKLDELVKARFVEMFGDLIENDKQWNCSLLCDISNIVSGITKGRKIRGTELIEVPYMAVSNVKDGYIDWTTVKTILATHSEIEQYRIFPEDILMTEGGDPDKLGRGAIIHEVPENCIHQNHIFRVRLDEAIILPMFFSEYLQSPKAKRYFFGCAKQTTGIASINMRQLKALPVLIPPLQLQEQFATFVEQINKSKVAVQKALDEAQLLFDSLMQEYFG